MSDRTFSNYRFWRKELHPNQDHHGDHPSDSTNNKKKSQNAKQNLKIHLGILTQFYPPDYAATGQLIEELAQNLSQQNLEVRIFTGQPSYAFKTQSAAPWEQQGSLLIRRSKTSRLWPHRIRGRAINGILFALRACVRLLSPWWRVDILMITTEPPYLNILGYVASYILGIPYICLIYDLYPDVAVALNVVPESHWLTKIWRFLNHKIWHQASAIIVLSSTMRDRIVAHCPGVESKITVIHSWSDPNLIQPLPKQQNWFARHHGCDRLFTVLYSGNMGRCHDMDTILATVKLLQNDPIQFVFIGSGAKQKVCRETVTKLNLKNCLFLPYQDKTILPYSLTACDVALVSIDQGLEGLVVPSKLYGSLAAGRPIAAICENHSYLRKILNTAQCGQAFENQDSEGLAQFLRYLSQNSHIGTQMGENGRQYLQKYFTPQHISQLYLQVVSRCVKPKMEDSMLWQESLEYMPDDVGNPLGQSSGTQYAESDIAPAVEYLTVLPNPSHDPPAPA